MTSTDKRIVKKALAYITHGTELLVFRQPDFPEAGIQVPKGTIDEDETPFQTIEREIVEETGLRETAFIQFLGETHCDVSDSDKPVLEHWHFFHFTLTGEKKDVWAHYELFDSASKGPILFSFFWLPIIKANEILMTGHGQFLHLIEEFNVKS